MNQIWTYSILSVAIVSLISLTGALTLALNKNFLKKILLTLVSFAVGGLFGDAFIHLIPESFKDLGLNAKTPLLILTGILMFFILEKFIRWRHCHAEPCEDHAHPVVAMNLIGDGVHNMIDGMLIAASFMASIPIGIATTIAIVLHEIPQEIGDFAVLVHGGFSVKRALVANFICSLLSVAGALIILLAGPYLSEYTKFILPITAGGFIYMAGSDLIPELHHDVKPKTSALQLASILAGIGIMALLLLKG